MTLETYTRKHLSEAFWALREARMAVVIDHDDDQLAGQIARASEAAEAALEREWRLTREQEQAV